MIMHLKRHRIAMTGLLGELKDKASIDILVDLVAHARMSCAAGRGRCIPWRSASSTTLSIASSLLTAYPRKHRALAIATGELLLSRPSWARAYMAAIDRGQSWRQAKCTLDQLGRFAALQPGPRRPGTEALGSDAGVTREERLAEVRRLNNDLRATTATRRGRQLFHDRCATCHRLERRRRNDWSRPTLPNRRDRDFLLVSLVDPAVVVRKEYQSYTVVTKDGRVLNGLIVEQTPEVDHAT